MFSESSGAESGAVIPSAGEGESASLEAIVQRIGEAGTMLAAMLANLSASDREAAQAALGHLAQAARLLGRVQAAEGAS